MQDGDGHLRVNDIIGAHRSGIKDQAHDAGEQYQQSEDYPVGSTNTLARERAGVGQGGDPDGSLGQPCFHVESVVVPDHRPNFLTSASPWLEHK